MTTAANTEVTTGGMTSKVVKGSIWVLFGQVFPLIATFISAPFVIRGLGPEAYGVLLLVGMIPTYFVFADCGMSLASTKFGSEAYGEGDPVRESKVISTAAFIAFITASIGTILLIIFSHFIVTELVKVPAAYVEVASLGLKLTALGFLFNVLSSVYNTPQLSRLKMNLNVSVNAIPKVVMILLTPVVLYFGGGITEAIILASAAGLIIFVLNFLVSGKLLPGIYDFHVDVKLIKPLLKFGKGVILYSGAFLLIFNLEKLIIPSITTPKQLAFYSVAYTFANLATMYNLAIGQTLVPAFSQMLAPEKKPALNLLFSRTFQGSLLLLMPLVMFLIVIARPFFTLWAGPEFGANSIIPFYILMVGVFFSLLMYIPNSILLAHGRTMLFAKIYWIEITPYFLLAYFLIINFGISGAAMAWSARETINAFLFFQQSKRVAGLQYGLEVDPRYFGLSVFCLVPPVLLALNTSNYYLLSITVLISLFLYVLVVRKHLVSFQDRELINTAIGNIIKKRKFK